MTRIGGLRLLALCLGLLCALPRGAWALNVEQVQAMTDAEILALSQKGKLRPQNWSSTHVAMICLWAEADRREVLTQVVKANPDALPGYPLLACAPSREAYDYWKAMGAGNGKLKLSDHMGPSRFGTDSGTSLAIAAANLNVASVAAHLADGVSIDQRGGKMMTPLGAVLDRWLGFDTTRKGAAYHVPDNPEETKERAGVPGGLIGMITNLNEPLTGLSGLPTLRQRKQDVASAVQIVRLLMEAGASLDELSATGYMAAKGSGHPGWRRPGRTWRMEVQGMGANLKTRDQLALAEAERYGKEIRGYAAPCRNWNEEACRQLLSRADDVSPLRALASRQIAALEKKRADWTALMAKQTCKLQSPDWVYTGRACEGGLAHGRGSAERWWSGERFSGRFERGGLAEGALATRDGQPLFEGRVGPQGALVAGKQFEAGKVVYDGAFTADGKRHGNGVCWVGGSPEECRYHEGERIDSLHKQRQENQQLRQELAEQRRKQEEQQRPAPASGSGGGFQWGKLAALGAGAAIGGFKDLPSEVQSRVIAGIVRDSQGGQEGVSGLQGALAAPAAGGAAGAGAAGGEEARNRAIAQRCEARATGLKPWQDPQLDTQCQLATFNRCLSEAGINAYENERRQACANLKGVLDSIGGSLSACPACN